MRSVVDRNVVIRRMTVILCQISYPFVLEFPKSIVALTATLKWPQFAHHCFEMFIELHTKNCLLQQSTILKTNAAVRIPNSRLKRTHKIRILSR
jgi:hypothetical protein